MVVSTKIDVTQGDTCSSQQKMRHHGHHNHHTLNTCVCQRFLRLFRCYVQKQCAVFVIRRFVRLDSVRENDFAHKQKNAPRGSHCFTGALSAIISKSTNFCIYSWKICACRYSSSPFLAAESVNKTKPNNWQMSPGSRELWAAGWHRRFRLRGSFMRGVPWTHLQKHDLLFVRPNCRQSMCGSRKAPDKLNSSARKSRRLNKAACNAQSNVNTQLHAGNNWRVERSCLNMWKVVYIIYLLHCK